MTTKAPSTRRKFASEWDEIDYLYHKLLYWLYERAQPAKALAFARRLERVLESAPGAAEAIRTAECRSLICEARGDLRGAIQHRENEVRLIRRLHKLSRDGANWHYVRRQYDYADLSDRLDLLAALYHDSRDLDRAVRTLEESQQLSEAHGFAFDGQDMLAEYRAEKDAAPGRRGQEG